MPEISHCDSVQVDASSDQNAADSAARSVLNLGSSLSLCCVIQHGLCHLTGTSTRIFAALRVFPGHAINRQEGEILGERLGRTAERWLKRGYVSDFLALQLSSKNKKKSHLSSLFGKLSTSRNPYVFRTISGPETGRCLLHVQRPPGTQLPIQAAPSPADQSMFAQSITSQCPLMMQAH